MTKETIGTSHRTLIGKQRGKAAKMTASNLSATYLKNCLRRRKARRCRHQSAQGRVCAHSTRPHPRAPSPASVRQQAQKATRADFTDNHACSNQCFSGTLPRLARERTLNADTAKRASSPRIWPHTRKIGAQKDQEQRRRQKPQAETQKTPKRLRSILHEHPIEVPTVSTCASRVRSMRTVIALDRAARVATSAETYLRNL